MKKIDGGVTAAKGFQAAVWKEPYCYDVTPEEEIERKVFSANDEGLCQITDWINEKAN